MSEATPVVLDTHTLLWWTLDPESLSSRARALGAEAERGGAGLHVSSISLWEIAIKVERGKLELGMSPGDYWKRVQRLGYIEAHPVDVQLWLRNVALDWEHRDPADRTIVALAQREGLPLLTKDALIRAFYRDTLW